MNYRKYYEQVTGEKLDKDFNRYDDTGLNNFSKNII